MSFFRPNQAETLPHFRPSSTEYSFFIFQWVGKLVGPIQLNLYNFFGPLQSTNCINFGPSSAEFNFLIFQWVGQSYSSYQPKFNHFFDPHEPSNCNNFGPLQPSVLQGCGHSNCLHIIPRQIQTQSHPIQTHYLGHFNKHYMCISTSICEFGVPMYKLRGPYY